MSADQLSVFSPLGVAANRSIIRTKRTFEYEHLCEQHLYEFVSNEHLCEQHLCEFVSNEHYFIANYIICITLYFTASCVSYLRMYEQYNVVD